MFDPCGCDKKHGKLSSMPIMRIGFDEPWNDALGRREVLFILVVRCMFGGPVNGQVKANRFRGFGGDPVR